MFRFHGGPRDGLSYECTANPDDIWYVKLPILKDGEYLGITKYRHGKSQPDASEHLWEWDRNITDPVERKIDQAPAKAWQAHEWCWELEQRIKALEAAA